MLIAWLVAFLLGGVARAEGGAAAAPAIVVTGEADASPESRAARAPGVAQEGDDVVHVTISGPLDLGVTSLMRRAIDRALVGGKLLVVELDTPGGELELMFELSRQIADANVEGLNSVAWIHDRAYSAGALVALACRRVYMRSSAAIGAAAVIQIPVAGMPGGIEDPTLAEKMSSATRAAFRAAAESGGRPAAVAEAMVDRDVGALEIRTKDGELRIVTSREYDDLRELQGGISLVRTIAEPGRLVSLSGAEAVRIGIADGIAESFESLMGILGATGTAVIPIERSRSEDFATWLGAVRYLLIGLGVIALIAEFKAPGFGLAGAIAILCFGLALFGSYLTGLADVPHLVAVGLGLVLLAVELFLVPGMIWPGAVGAVLVIGGLVFAQAGGSFLESPLGRELAIDRALKTLGGTLLALITGALVTRFLPRTALASRVLQTPTPAFAGGAPAAEFERAPVLGERGVATTPLRPVGKVRLEAAAGRRAAEIEARSSGTALDAGQRVRVVAVEGLRAVVEPDREVSA